MSKHSPIRAARAIVAATGSPGSAPETPDFTPAAPQPHGDGWSPQRQLDYIAALAHWLGNLRKDSAAQAEGRRVRRAPEPDATEWLNDAEGGKASHRPVEGTATDQPVPTSVPRIARLEGDVS